MEVLDCGWMMLSLIGVDSLRMIMASVVVALFVFTRFGRSRPGFEMNKLAFMLIITAALVVLDTDVGFDLVPVIRSVVKKCRCNSSTSPVLHFEAGTLTSKARTKITMKRLFCT